MGRFMGRPPAMVRLQVMARRFDIVSTITVKTRPLADMERSQCSRRRVVPRSGPIRFSPQTPIHQVGLFSPRDLAVALFSGVFTTGNNPRPVTPWLPRAPFLVTDIQLSMGPLPTSLAPPPRRHVSQLAACMVIRISISGPPRISDRPI